MDKVNIAVIGSGSWATALTKILTMNEHHVRWCVRSEDAAAHIRNFHHNPKYLSTVEFNLMPENISANAAEIISGCDYVLLASPSAYLKSILETLPKGALEGKKIISAIKGIIQPENLLVSEYISQTFNIGVDNIANISGPCHAEEVAAEKLSYLTFSSPNKTFADEVAAIFKNRILNTAATTDLKGTEYASVLKNVYALVTGISVGLGYGDNFRAVLVTAGMAEMSTFLDAVCPSHRSILSPAYLGDTLVTAYSQHSRNRSFGLMIGRGYTVNAAILELNMVAEGYFATKALKTIAASYNLQLPILDAAYRILYEKYSSAIEFRVLAGEIG
ncbi:MAG: NAD(P)-binding domain-containing protein [Bacteroidetes bacterium]|nr:NAD(P)-binding domain-containing protein [Bacteroidota bacterium]